MGRYKITELLLIIYFIGIHNSSGDYVEDTKKLYKAETELFDRLLFFYKKVININPEEGSSSYQQSLFIDNGDLNRYPDEIMFDLVQVWYTLFWISVNLKIRSMVHKMEFIDDPSRTKDSKIAEDFDSLFNITSEIFQNLKSDISNYYGSMQSRIYGSMNASSDSYKYWFNNEETSYYRSVQSKNLCGTTNISPSDTDTDSSIEETNIDIDTAKSVWEELLKLNLDFLMSAKSLENREYSSDNEYIDGLVKWSKINCMGNGHKTILPNNSPEDTNYFVIDGYYKRVQEHDFIKSEWCLRMIRSIIDVNIHDKIINCFQTRLIGDTMNNRALYQFMIIDTPNVEELKYYLKKFNKGPQDIHKTIAAIQMVRIFKEQILMSHITYAPNVENLLSQMKKNLEERKKKFLGGVFKRLFS